MKKNIGILIFDGAEVLDFAGPFEVFAVASELRDHRLFHVFTVAKEKRLITAVNGLLVHPNFTFSDSPRLDILIIAGGSGSRALLHDAATLAWIQKVHETTEFTASICSGARLLAKLNLLHEKPYCTHQQVYAHLQELAPTGIPQKEKRFIQSDQRLFTSGGISAGIDLSFHLLEKIAGRELVLETAKYMEYELCRNAN